jgi:hypothetical protein
MTIEMQKLCTTSIVDRALEEGGRIQPLIVDAEQTEGLGLMNPSIFKDEDKWIVNVRNVSYTLHHCDPPMFEGNNQDGRFQTPWGPLNYVRPDNDPYLRTTNHVGYLNFGKGVDTYHKIDTSNFPKMPEWDFVGHEDGRLVKWDDKLWITGVRRHAPNGKGRMQLSHIIMKENGVKEIERHIIEVEDASSYCEKNWMPILDMPFHYVKWLNPLDIVKVDINTNKATNVKLGDYLPFPTHLDLRGGSQVVPYGDYRVAITHDVDYWVSEKGDRDSHYNHRMVVWDKEWNIVSVTKPWKFMHGKIEFCCGLAFEDDMMHITFGYQDNSAYLFTVPWDYMNNLPKEEQHD